MATTPSLKIVKTFTWKGATRQFSSRYHFSAGSPADAGKWTALSDAVVLAEKTCYASNVTIVQAYGYDAGSDVPVHSKAYTTAGTANLTGYPYMVGEAAALVRYATGSRTAKNHPLYLFNYYHGVRANSATDGDTLSIDQRTPLLAYGNAWITGFSDGAVTHKRAGPNGQLAIGCVVPTTVTHRDFPR